MKEEINLIGIDGSNRSQVVGSVVMAMVTVKPNFFRKFTWLKIKSSKLLSRSEIQKVVENTQKYVIDVSIESIKAKDLYQNDADLNDLEMIAIIHLLNQKLKFWKHKIFINNSDEEGFSERFTKLAPDNLKIDKLKMSKWTIKQSCNEKFKICSLASCYARYYSNIERDDIKSIWGDFGSGDSSDTKTIQFLKEQPECPHIRKLLGGNNGKTT